MVLYLWNADLQVELETRKIENENLLKDINELKATILSIISIS